MNPPQITEAEIFQNRLAWAASLKGAPKARFFLTRILENGKEADCCLGIACKSLSIKRMATTRGVYEYGGNGETATLPYTASQRLGVSRLGELTQKGSEYADALLGITQEERGSLPGYNDTHCGSDPTLDNMKQLIDWLLVLEYLFGVQCFERP